MRQVRYVWARSLECWYLGVRTYRAHRSSNVDMPGRPAFTTAGGGIALTIDDGPDPRWTPALLDVLARHDVRATFFLIGARAADHPRLAARVAAAGHTIGNHTMHHPMPFAALEPARIRTEIRDAQELIADAVGVPPSLFRAPSGSWSRRVLDIAAELGLSTVDWTVNTSDWKEPGVPHIIRALARSRPGHVVLCHDGGGDRSQTVAALDQALPMLSRRGLRFVTVAPAGAKE